MARRSGNKRHALAVARSAKARASRHGSRSRHWTELSDRELLARPIASLDLSIAGSPLEARLAELEHELEARGLRFRPYTWLSSDWFTPDGLTGFAIPFFLAHPRLMRLERNQMLEVEGGTQAWCMQLLRHETAHAFDNAYGLHRKKRWRDLFGRFTTPYRQAYTPDPESRDFVHNLDYWYSQSHPAEDYAETFAVWLDPSSRWRRRYATWPALRKLEGLDAWLAELGPKAPPRRTRRRIEPTEELELTLGEYYRAKRAIYAGDEPVPDLSPRLEELFRCGGRRASAATFLRKNRRRLLNAVARATGQHRYLVDHVLREMILRCKQLDLRLSGPEDVTLTDAAALLSSLTMRFLYGGHPRYHR